MLTGIGIYRLARLEFPGRAGELQRGRASASLVRELGDNYSAYHGYLRAELARFGGRPQPKDYDDQASYFAAWARIQEIVMAEALVRACVAFRRNGRPLGAPVDTSVPLVDANDQLVAAYQETADQDVG